MARIPEEEIDRIKQTTDLAALVRSRGIELKAHGSRDLIGRCPFHEENDPSFIVSPAKGLFHCMGCGAARKWGQPKILVVFNLRLFHF